MIRAEDRYVATFTSLDPETMRVGEVDVVLPDMPDEKDMFNFEKAIHDQKYTRTTLDKNMKVWGDHQLDMFAKSQWHRRINGEWWLIKGQPFYFPGGALLFFDYWTTKGGKSPTFRMEALEFFVFWYLYVERDPNLFGMFDLKCRRLGDTEKAMFVLWERTTRYRGVVAGLQSYTDTEAEKNYRRLIKGHRNMPYFFKPKHSGSDEKQLLFTKPTEVVTMKKLKEAERAGFDVDHDFLNSEIHYEAAVTGKFDGQQLHTYSMDEVFKMDPSRMDVKAQWANMKKVMSLYNDAYIYGKAILSSTVEEKTKDADRKGIETTVEVAEYLWDNSNPHDRDENGRTYTGLARLFRGYQLAAKVDEWGFHQVEEATKFRNVSLSKARAKGDFAEVMNIFRKQPATPEEALSDSSDNCVLYPEMMHARLNQIKNGLDRYDNPIANYTPKVVEGELVWKNGMPYTEVEFIPKKGGKWHISQFPHIPNYVQTRYMEIMNLEGEREWSNVYYPMNMPIFRMGCDPYDSANVIGKGSDGSFTVKRRLDIASEIKDIRFDSMGMIENVEDMTTNTYICDYKFRHKNPEFFYMDVVKTCWFFGCAVFPELDKPGLVNFMKRMKLHGFIQYEPPALMPSSRRIAGQGVKATGQIVDTYVDLLKIYCGHYVWNQHHPRILRDWSRFIPAKRTKFDMSVATGFTEMADMDGRYKPEEEEGSRWTHSPLLG